MTPGNRAAGRLFMRAAQAGRAAEAHVDRFTAPLFPLPLILEAEGTLAADARHLARGTDPETSHDAAAKALGFAGAHEKLIAEAIEAAGEHGACSKEVARRTGLTHVQVDRRLAGMNKRFLITRLYERDADDVRRLVKREGCAVWVTYRGIS